MVGGIDVRARAPCRLAMAVASSSRNGRLAAVPCPVVGLARGTS